MKTKNKNTINLAKNIKVFILITQHLHNMPEIESVYSTYESARKAGLDMLDGYTDFKIIQAIVHDQA